MASSLMFGVAAKSALLINEGGKFSKIESPVTSSGMVTDVKWADVDGDKRADLIMSSEWGPVRVYQNKENGFQEVTKNMGLDQFSGWWNCVLVTDIDKDGDNDIIAGNFGTNTKSSLKKCSKMMNQ